MNPRPQFVLRRHNRPERPQPCSITYHTYGFLPFHVLAILMGMSTGSSFLGDLDGQLDEGFLLVTSPRRNPIGSPVFSSYTAFSIVSKRLLGSAPSVTPSHKLWASPLEILENWLRSSCFEGMRGFA